MTSVSVRKLRQRNIRVKKCGPSSLFSPNNSSMFWKMKITQHSATFRYSKYQTSRGYGRLGINVQLTFNKCNLLNKGGRGGGAETPQRNNHLTHFLKKNTVYDTIARLRCGYVLWCFKGSRRITIKDKGIFIAVCWMFVFYIFTWQIVLVWAPYDLVHCRLKKISQMHLKPLFHTLKIHFVGPAA